MDNGIVVEVPVLICVVQFAVSVANWLVTVSVQPRPLPRMDFRRGIPPEHRTMVVVPTMLLNAAATDDLLEQLEIRYLANRDSNLHFALLTDLRDAPQAVMPGTMNLSGKPASGVS